MLFTSLKFIIFLAIVITLYYIVPKKCQWPFLLAASYIFYFIAGPTFLIYISVTSLTTYAAAVCIENKRDAFSKEFKLIKKELDKEGKKKIKALEKKKEKRIMLACLLFNLGILAVVKYTNFAISNVNAVIKAFDMGDTISYMNIVLPMGISFYTFQSMGYLIDIYFGKYKAERNPFKFALFVSFFPQLVQGPISRYNDLSLSLYEEHKADYKTICFGIQRIMWGFFKKLVIADRVVVAVTAISQDTAAYKGEFVFVGMMLYALQLYADFTGGIDITIGVAQTLGIKVAENFRRPFFSKNIKEYWNRWHITMGSWFTDYIFYPLSVSNFMLKLNKKARAGWGKFIGKRVPVYLSAFVVWFTTGIWHGASWSFIVWGLSNFVVIMVSQELEPFYRWFHSKFNVDGKTAYKAFQVIRTVLLMSCLRTFDCYRDVPTTFKMFGSLFTDFHISHLTGSNLLGLGLTAWDYGILFVGFIMLLTVSLIQRKGSVREKLWVKPAPVKFVIWYGLFVIILMFGAYGVGYDATQFIYNQF